MDQIQHWMHRHPLLLGEDHSINNKQFTCEVCAEDIIAPYYVCDSCKFYIHKSCAELPRQINHPFHPSHPLTLFPEYYYCCYSCHKYFYNALSFECDKCNFNMDVECALMPPITCEGQENIRHFTHQHPMPLVDVDDKDEIKCFVCHLPSSSAVIYGCTKCKHFLHKSCAELPRKILHPYHPNHSLLDLQVQHPWFECELCQKASELTLSFRCLDECCGPFCVDCCVKPGLTVKGTIRYEDHEHLLCFLEDPGLKLAHCNGYDAYCNNPVISDSIEIYHSQSSIFRCLDCDFRVHLLCGPLPSIIEFKCHTHRLILTDSFVEDSSDEYYCDICETKRDPRIRVYYCRECKYVAHVRCLISEITNLLKGDLRDVELKTVGAKFWELPQEINSREEQHESALTFKDLLDQFPHSWLREDFEWDTPSHEVNKEQQEVSQSTTDQLLDLRDEFIDELLRFSRFTEEDFLYFTLDLKSNFTNRKLKINPADLALKIVDVRGYKVPYTLAPVLKMLLHKYGDISLLENHQNLDQSIELKSIAFSFLCKVVKQMHSTRVLDITKDLLQDWYFYLGFASWRANFDTRFLKPTLQKITRAFISVQLTKLEVHIPTAICIKIEKLHTEIAELKHKLEESKKFRSGKPKFVNDCLNEAANLKWKMASEV